MPQIAQFLTDCLTDKERNSLWNFLNPTQDFEDTDRLAAFRSSDNEDIDERDFDQGCGHRMSPRRVRRNKP